jgi:hypothetical protein
VLFVACTAALAAWTVVRRPWWPASLTAVICHATLALVALQLSFVLVGAGSPAWWRFAGLLLVVTPALVYVWLSAAWTALFARSRRHGAAG